MSIFADNLVAYVEEDPTKSVKKTNKQTKKLPKTIKWVWQGLKIQDKHKKTNFVY